MLLWRLRIAEPPAHTMRDLREWITIGDVLDANEMPVLKAAVAERARD